MKHRIVGKKLGRNHHERQSLFRILAYSLFTNGSVKTTNAKAKAVIPLIEKLCSATRKADLIAYRRFFKYFQDRNLAKLVVTAIRTAFADQSSNFTKTTKIKKRLGDQAVIVRLAFTKPYQLNPPKEVAK